MHTTRDCSCLYLLMPGGTNAHTSGWVADAPHTVSFAQLLLFCNLVNSVLPHVAFVKPNFTAAALSLCVMPPQAVNADEDLASHVAWVNPNSPAASCSLLHPDESSSVDGC